uniref:Gypsy retrotransposon integrase-like protein 1 n=1 Tax=Oreochromis niloticus TaxID=8128 RepID=A0A669EDT9_ORENI
MVWFRCRTRSGPFRLFRVPRPASVKALQEFLGMVNFYNRFLPRAAHLLQPLYAALKGKTAKDPIDWLPECIQAFSEAKAALANAALLAHPFPSAEIALTTDASDVAVGTVLEQRVSGVWQPLAFFSRTLRDSERKYSVFDRELLALHLATRHFRFFLEGRSFTAYVDHKPLTFAMSKVSDPWSGRQQRQLAAISEFTTDIQHVAGKSNCVADCLSRALVSPVYVGIDFDAMAADQRADPDVLALRSEQTGLVLEDRPVWNGGPSLLCDVSTGRLRPVVPLSWRRRVFDSVHALSHPGVQASVKLVSSRFIWPGLRKSVKDWAAACIPCQRAKIHRHTQAPLESFHVPGRRFDHVNVDLVGPLPQSQGFTHLLTVVDRTTRWPEAVPLASTTAAAVARAFLSTWVSRFGPPADITSDRGPQFVSELWSAMADGLGVKVHRTTAYHPQANGMCERFHRSLKAAFRASLTDGNWVDRLPWVLLGLRCAVKEDLGVSPAELVLGQPLRVPGEFLPESPPRASLPLCCLSVPRETRFLFLAQCTIVCPTPLFRGRWTLRSLFSSGMTLIGLRCVHCMTAPLGLFNRAGSISFWTLGVVRRLFLLTDLSRHMCCRMISWCRLRPPPWPPAFHWTGQPCFFL